MIRTPVRTAAGAKEVWRFGAAAAGVALTAAVLVTGLSLGGAAAGAAIFGGVVAFTARDPVPSPLGLANQLTLARLAALAALAGVGLSAIVAPEAHLVLTGWIPCLVYGATALADQADGAIARRTGTTSAFGARLDAEADALGLALASGIAVLVAGTLPLWYLGAGFARYLFGAALFAERRLGRPLRDLHPSPFRRRLAGFQMGLLAVCLAPSIEAEWATPSALALGVPFLIGFARDYLVRSGRMDPEGAKFHRLSRRFDNLRRPMSHAALAAAIVLGILKTAGLAIGSWGLAAFFLGWLLLPARKVRGNG